IRRKPFRVRVQRFSNCHTPKPRLSSGFFLKKKAPCTGLAGATELENRSKKKNMAHKESFGLPVAILLASSLVFSLGVAVAQAQAPVFPPLEHGRRRGSLWPRRAERRWPCWPDSSCCRSGGGRVFWQASGPAVPRGASFFCSC